MSHNLTPFCCVVEPGVLGSLEPEPPEKNQEPEPHGKKSGAGPEAAKKFAGISALRGDKKHKEITGSIFFAVLPY